MALPKIKSIGKLLAAALLSGLAAQAQAQEWRPDRSIRMLIPAGPGGASDTLARLIGVKLTASLGQSVVPENRPGAGTVIASDMVAKAAPDGYMFVVITGSHTLNGAVRKSLPYDPIKDFTPVTLLATLPDLLVVKPTLPITTVKQLIERARAEPGKLTMGSAGVGSNTHLEGELFKQMANVDMLHVPYKTGMDAVAGMLGSQIDVLFFNAIGVAEQVRNGRLRALATTKSKRMEMFPDVPTVAEAGVPGFDTGSWYAVLLPPGTPAAIVKRYNKEIHAALQAPDVRKAILATGAEITPTTPEGLTEFMRKDLAQWRSLVERRPELRVNE
jgi:tripartite-type tricarboxylate transporter receptor subunit TctC